MDARNGVGGSGCASTLPWPQAQKKCPSPGDWRHQGRAKETPKEPRDKQEGNPLARDQHTLTGNHAAVERPESNFHRERVTRAATRSGSVRISLR